MLTSRPAFGPLTRLRLARRRRAAEAYAGAGWPVVAGAWWDQARGRYSCGAQCGVAGQHAVCDGGVPGPDTAGAGPGRLAATPGGFPHTVMLVTGLGVDVVELPATARGVAIAAARSGVATAQLPTGRHLLFAASGPLDPGNPLPDRLIMHGEGSMVALPPSQLRHGPVEWSGRFRRPPAVGELRPVAEVLGLVREGLAAGSWPGGSPSWHRRTAAAWMTGRRGEDRCRYGG